MDSRLRGNDEIGDWIPAWPFLETSPFVMMPSAL
jgi:hypothetical protein